MILDTERLKEMANEGRSKTPANMIRNDDFFRHKPTIKKFKDTDMFMRHGIPEELFVTESAFDKSKTAMQEALRRIDKSIA